MSKFNNWINKLRLKFKIPLIIFLIWLDLRVLKKEVINWIWISIGRFELIQKSIL
jgi:hypothetical protein